MARDVGLSLSVRDILQNPVLGSLAAMTKKAMKNTTTSTITVPYSLLARTGCAFADFKENFGFLPCCGIRRRGCVPMRKKTTQSLRGRNSFAAGSTTVQHTITLPADIDLDRLEIALRRIVRSTKILRSRVIRVSGKLIQVVCKDNEGSAYRPSAHSACCS